jgi:integrase
MKACLSKQHGKWRIIVPTAITGTGKRKFLFFNSKREAEDKAREIRYSGLNPAKDLKADDVVLLNLLKQKYSNDPTEIIRQLDLAEKHSAAVPKEKRLSLEKVCEAYMDAHVGHHPKTKSKYNSTLNRLCAALDPEMPMLELTEEKIKEGYLAKRFKDKAPGTLLTQYRNVHAFVVWAFENHYLAVNPFERSKPPAKWNAKKEILDLESFREILQTCEQNPQFHRLIPFFALGGLAGIRRCELISSQSADKDPRLEWRDILWDKNQIRVRHEVAKETQAEDRRRVIPLEPSLRQWLQLVPKTEGPIMAISQSQLQRDKAELLETIKVKVSENALRNSYASYGAAFRSLGDVARAMGDLEVTIKRYYVDLVDDPELGRAWFNIWPGTKSNIISLAV